MTHTNNVKLLDPYKKYNFIKRDNGRRYTLTHISTLQKTGLDDLSDNQKLEYKIVRDRDKKSISNIKKLNM